MEQYEAVTDEHLAEAVDLLYGTYDPEPRAAEQHQQFEAVTDEHLAEAVANLFI